MTASAILSSVMSPRLQASSVSLPSSSVRRRISISSRALWAFCKSSSYNRSTSACSSGRSSLGSVGMDAFKRDHAADFATSIGGLQGPLGLSPAGKCSSRSARCNPPKFYCLWQSSSAKEVMAGWSLSGCGLFPGRTASAVIMPAFLAAFSSSTRSLTNRICSAGSPQSAAMAS